jgi:hypothetical protein
MNGLKIIISNTWTPSRLVSSGLHPTTTTSGLNTTAEELVTTMVLASTAIVNVDRTASPRLLSSRARRSLWARVQDALSVEGMTATRGPLEKPDANATNEDGASDTVNAYAPIDTANADGIAEALAASKPTSGTSRVELTIDSLRTYELVKPIPVFVESLGERHYVADVPDLNITTSASSLSEILIVLKDSVTQTYDKLRIRRSLDPEQTRQLKMLEKYIGKSKRGGWTDGDAQPPMPAQRTDKPLLILIARAPEFRSDVPRRRAAQCPEGDAAANIGGDRQGEGQLVAAGQIEDPARRP